MAFLNEIKYKKELEKILYPNNTFIAKGKMDFGSPDAKTIQYPVSAGINVVKTGSPALPLSKRTPTHLRRLHNRTDLRYSRIGGERERDADKLQYFSGQSKPTSIKIEHCYARHRR